MNHQPFKEWLVADEPLTAEQIQSLQAHISSCESCSQMESALKEVDLTLRKAHQIEPASGFMLRWQERLVEYHAHRQSRSGWWTIAATALIASVLLILLINQLWSLFQAPGPYLALLLDRLVGVISIYYILQNMVSSTNWSASIYTLIGLSFLVGIISFMSVLWLAAYRKLSLARRVA